MLIRYAAYLQILNRFLKKIDEKDIKEFADRIWKTRVWLIGNGGSCSLASHMSEDLCKSAKVKAVAISDSPLITASGNDCQIITRQFFSQVTLPFADFVKACPNKRCCNKNSGCY